MGFPPRLHGGRLSAGMTGEGGAHKGRAYGDAEGEGEGVHEGGVIPRLGLAAFGMTLALSKRMKMDSV